MQNTTTQWRRTTQFFLEKYTSHFIKRVRKGYSKFYCERELETEQNWNTLIPTLMAISVVSFSFSRATQPEARVPSFLLSAVLSPTCLVSKTHRLPAFTELYNNSVAHSISLEWHVWSSSSGNNCHAVHRSLSSGASVYDCTMGFYLVPYCQPDSPTPIEYALPPSLEWHVWWGRRSIYYIIFYISKLSNSRIVSVIILYIYIYIYIYGGWDIRKVFMQTNLSFVYMKTFSLFILEIFF